MSYKEYTVRVFKNGTKCWYLNDKRHREDGPVIEYADGDKFWYINGVLHREDGPAIEYPNGDKEWWIDGKQLTEKEFLSRKQGNSCDGKIVEIDGVKYLLKAL
jgi:hypothetical protein